MQMNNIEEFLAAVPIFSGMSPLELVVVEAFLERRHLKKGETLFREGEQGEEFFIVAEGLIGSYVTQNDGTKREIYSFKPGSQFGEMAVIEAQPRSATCYAKEDTELFVLDGIDFYRIIWEYPVFGAKMLRSMIRTMTSWLDEASGFLNDTVRLGETARKRSITDELSGLFNRRFLEESAKIQFSRGRPQERHSALIMLDIDHFRDINAEYGSSAGDGVISALGGKFENIVIDPVIAARLSGDEFAIFLPGGRLEEARTLAENLRRAAEALDVEWQPPDGKEIQHIRATISLGAAESEKDFETLSAAADRALYLAKESGRNRVMVSSADKD